MRSVLTLILFASTSVAAQEITLRQIATGLESPVALAHANDARLFIAVIELVGTLGGRPIRPRGICPPTRSLMS